jgi:hypothetical protein
MPALEEAQRAWLFAMVLVGGAEGLVALMRRRDLDSPSWIEEVIAYGQRECADFVTPSGVTLAQLHQAMRSEALLEFAAASIGLIEKGGPMDK